MNNFSTKFDNYPLAWFELNLPELLAQDMAWDLGINKWFTLVRKNNFGRNDISHSIPRYKLGRCLLATDWP